ncbi:MAG: tryptophan synthase subunit alpha [Nannocystaceae bacterium]|nr:tryptophan synthase subunit alpha [bacterium]
MSRIRSAFENANADGRAALVGYLTAYDPDLDGSLERIMAACDAGLDVLELGVPFSDPTADGPDVQAAMLRALAAGATLPRVLDLARAVRERTDIPIVLFSYANPLVQMGSRLGAAAANAGVDGLLVVDCPPAHAAELRDPAVARGLDWIGLVAPTTNEARMSAVAEVSTGFVYAVTLKGVTGAELDADAEALSAQLAAVKERFSIPVAAGFGVRSAKQAKALAGKADGVVVGSALIRAAAQSVGALADLVRDLHAGTER